MVKIMTLTSNILIRFLGFLRIACILLAVYWLLWGFYEANNSGVYVRFCQGQFFLTLVGVAGVEVLRHLLRRTA